MQYATLFQSNNQIRPPRRQHKRNITSAADTPTSPLQIIPNKNTITKTISNYFFQLEKVPQAIEERTHFKTVISKPFFTKNRKMIQSNHRMRRDGNPVIVPNGFRNILRAKSTVIKQKKLQEFYINREGREGELQKLSNNHVDPNDFQSNLFKPNFPRKKDHAARRKSVNVQKCCQQFGEKQGIYCKLQDKGLSSSIHSITQNLCEMILREKQSYQQNGQIVLLKKKISLSQSNNQWKYQKRHKQNHVDKENLQFALSPWGDHDCDQYKF